MRRSKEVASQGVRAVVLNTRITWLVVLLGYSCTTLAEPSPRSLDQALTETLALGDAGGCFETLGIPDLTGGVDADNLDGNPDGVPDNLDLQFLRNNGQLGYELAGICASSAVNSAAALGGSLGSLQTTKTVSQFRLARRRVDSRLGLRSEKFGFNGPFLLAQLDKPFKGTMTDASALEPTPKSGFGVFAQGDYERRNRVTTAIEAGYKADIVGGLIGVDYALPDGMLVGTWVGYGNTNADYRSTSPLFGAATSVAAASLTPALLADICNIGPGGGFDNEDFKLGSFAGARFGNGFADVALQYSHRDYDYRRNTCAMELSDEAFPIIADGTAPSGFSNNNQPLDDIYAGTISGNTTLTEWSLSARAGYDFGDDRLLWGPRLSLTYLRAKIGGFTESGSTSVTSPVTSNPPTIATNRSPGSPTGLELAYDPQTRTSLQSELQFVAAYRIERKSGTFIPRATASWIHEFRGEREEVTVHMAQDLRATPTRFTFTTDSADKDKGVIALGVTALIDAEFAADLEIAHLVADSRFDSTTVTAQARWRF